MQNPDNFNDGFRCQIGQKNQYSLRSSSCTSADKYLSDEFVDDIALMNGWINTSKSDDEIVINITAQSSTILGKTSWLLNSNISILVNCLSQKGLSKIQITFDNKKIEEVLDFKCLGSYLMCSFADFNPCNGIAWKVIKNLILSGN